MPKLKIYFCGSISGDRSHEAYYYKMMDHLKKYATVLTEDAIKGADRVTGPPDQEKMDEIFKRDTDWLRKSDVVIADITIPSLGVGYEIGLAEALNKKILCLFKHDAGRNRPPMMHGNKRVTVKEYSTVEDAIKEIDAFVSR
jgi:2'-deoxynucleoside 5'-phosphate N-hydrolase